MKNKMKREYIVQQGIHLLKYNECIFDFRIMVQKNAKGIWESTGIIVRVANPKKLSLIIIAVGHLCHLEPFLRLI
jgi:hypothetical protein